MRALDLIGQRFGRLVVVARAAKSTPTRSHPYGRCRWRCICDCGIERVVIQAYLRAGDTNSCGCFARDKLIARSTRHGDAQVGRITSEFYTWCNMLRRCNDPNDQSFANYGGRGITVDERWLEFANFLADLGRKPSPTHTLDRINNDGPYAPGNCRWATRSTQARNSRHARLVTFNGLTLSLAEWAERVGISRTVLDARYRKDWPTDEMLLRPVGAKVSQRGISQEARRRGVRARWAPQRGVA